MRTKYEINDPTETEHSEWIKSMTETPALLVTYCDLDGRKWAFTMGADLPLRHDAKMEEFIQEHWSTLQAAKSRTLRRIREGVA